jgi:hypothetical protein
MRRFAFVIALAGCAGGGSSGTLHVSITDNAGSSVDLAPADSSNATGGKDTAGGIYDFDAQLDRPGGGHRLVILSIQDTPGTPPTAAHSFIAAAPPVGEKLTPGHAIVTLTDVAGDSDFSTWQSTSGSVTIVAVEGERVSVRFDAAMDPAPYTSGRGSFHVSGDCTVEKVAETKFLTPGP